MIIEIEYYKGDTLLYSKNKELKEIKEQIKTIENLYDVESDNFIPLLCRIYKYEVITSPITPDIIYDRDTHLFFITKL